MEEYLITARSVTQAQRMAQLLERRGVRAVVVGRVPMGLTGKGCGYVLRLRGQTRTAAISLKLAERELFRRDTGEEPVLLLDDVLSELDARRQDFVLNQIRSGQVLITCCEPDRLSDIGKRILIENGQVREDPACI